MATRATAKRTRPADKPAMAWVEERLRDPAHRMDVDALLTELDLRQDLVALREERGVTQAQLAELLGVKQPVIAKLEGGRTKDVKLSTLVKVAAALGARVRIELEKYAAAEKPARKKSA